MPTMAKPWLNPDTGIYGIRRRIPKDIQPLIGKGTHWKKSLETKDHREACFRFAAAYSESEEAFIKARAELAGIPVVLPSDAPKIVDRWSRGVLAEWEKDPSKTSRFLATVAPDHGGKDADRVPACDVLDLDNPRVRATITNSLISEILKGQRLPLPAIGSPARVALERTIFPRWVDLCHIAFDRNIGEWHTSLPLPDADKPLASEKEKADIQSSSALLSVAYSQWATAKRADTLNADNTVGTYGATITRFIELYGDLPLSQIKRATVHQFKDDLLRIPIKGKGIKGLTAKELIAKGEAEGLPTASLATVRNGLSHLSTIFNDARSRYETLGENPIEASGVLSKVKRQATRNPTRTRGEKGYSHTELRAMFGSPLFTGESWNPPRADYGKALYWLPLLFIYTGARREELAQLQVSNIRKDADTSIWFLYIRTQAERNETLKTADSFRSVPLHPDLITLGFLTYCDSLPKGSMLFPKLTKSRNGYGHNVGKGWKNYLDKVVKLSSLAAPIHGLRHTFKTLWREAGLREEVSDWITGHAPSGIGGEYGVNPLTQMVSELEKFPSIAHEAGLLEG
ncbi:MAG: site-specific integrase [Castellaniella sp.]|uniref:site-specific integrase n=1 Tax=Castellaniella sp. TaxID=1955812 RepID=UPI00122A9E70|nr:site-specific integrase [Castellaniella sp.]TAN28265.1 MAG: site-specific integrase [Castellaniella sp.]